LRLVDESDDLIEPWLVAIGGIDLYQGAFHRDPMEGVVMAREIRRVMIDDLAPGFTASSAPVFEPGSARHVMVLFPGAVANRLHAVALHSTVAA